MENTAVKYAPGMRIIVRGEEWMVKKVDTNSLGNQTLHVIGISQLVKDYDSMFLVDIENNIEIVNPAKVTLIPDDSAFFRKSKVYIESQWREKIPTDNKIHIGDKAAMDLMPYHALYCHYKNPLTFPSGNQFRHQNTCLKRLTKTNCISYQYSLSCQ